MSIIPSDVLIFCGPQESFILYNVFTRTSLALDTDGLRMFRGLAAGEPALAQQCRAWDVQRFSNATGLLEDPTRLCRAQDGWPQAETLSQAELHKRLLQRCLLVEDEAAYRARFQPKDSLLDFKNFGNFHQQLGQHLLLTERVDPVQWWYQQKFTQDLSGIRNNLYKAVQEHYLRRYFPNKLHAGVTIVDVGCGIGFYSRLMASCGAEVVAVDPNAGYIDNASKQELPNLRFLCAPIGAPGGLDALASQSADYVFMSDALLFYFIPEFPGQAADLGILMRDIHRILKPGGAFISLEPHPSFFLTPWLGDAERPYTVLTEYRNRRFSIVPSLAELAKGVMAHGFSLSFVDELYSGGCAGLDSRAHGFASEFPIWQLLEFQKVS